MGDTDPNEAEKLAEKKVTRREYKREVLTQSQLLRGSNSNHIQRTILIFEGSYHPDEESNVKDEPNKPNAEEDDEEPPKSIRVEDLQLGKRDLYLRAAKYLKPRIPYYIPIIQWLGTYHWKTDLFRDILAGITIGIMMIPQGLAYSSLALVPPIHGLVAAFVPLLIYVVMGTSRQISMGPEAMISILVGETSIEYLSEVGLPDTQENLTTAAYTLAFIVGFISLVMGIARFGFLSSVFSKPILRGFITAIALMIMLEQLDIVLGMSFPHDHGLAKIPAVFSNLDQVEVYAVIMSAVSLVVLFGLPIIKHFVKKSRVWSWVGYIPEVLVAVVLCIVVTALAELDQKGLKVLGRFEVGFPPPVVPDLSINSIRHLAIPAGVITIVGCVESIIIARSYAAKHNYTISANRELTAFGLQNMVGSFFGAYPVFGSMPRSAVNEKAGAKTQLSSLVTGLIILLTILVLLPLFELLPVVTMGSIVVAAAFKLIELEEVRFFLKMKAWKELVLMIITAVLTVLFGAEIGLVISIAFSLFFIIRGATAPRVVLRGKIPSKDLFLDLEQISNIHMFEDKHDFFKQVSKTEGILLARIEDSLHYANALSLKVSLKQLEQMSSVPLRGLILDMRNVDSIDVSGMEDLQEMLHDYHQQHVVVAMVKLNNTNQIMFKRAGLFQLIKQDHIFNKTIAALHFVEEELEDLDDSSSSDLGILLK